MQIHVARGEQQLGIFSPAEVRARLDSGELMPSDFGWTEGQAQWTPLASFPGVPVRAGFPASYIPGAQGVRSTSGAAIASLICGILSISFLPFIAAIPAVICGHIARSNIKRSGGTIDGGGMATAGLIMGYFGFCIFGLAVVAGLALPIFASIQAKGSETLALSQGKSIAIACRTYAADHQGAYPKDLEELMPNYINEPKILICPFDKSKDPIGYEYYGAGTKDSDSSATKVFLATKALSNGKRRVVVYFDSSAKVVRDMPELPPH